MINSKAQKDNLLEESSNHLAIIGGAGKGLHPFGHITTAIPREDGKRPMTYTPQTSKISTSEI